MSQDETPGLGIEEMVDKGATRVEEIHRTIAEVPFEILERNGLFEDLASDLREFHHRTVGAIYDAIRDVNHTVCEFTTELLEDDGEDESEEESR